MAKNVKHIKVIKTPAKSDFPESGKKKLTIPAKCRNNSIEPLLYGKNLTIVNRKNISEAYSQYINSFATVKDKRYLSKDKVIKRVVALRCIAGACLMTKDEFELKHFDQKCRLGTDYFFSTGKSSDDPLIQALADREKPNTVKTISTIIFICTRDSEGFTISGYIDYEQSLRRCKSEEASEERKWSQIFSGQKRIKPCKRDISFMDWKSGDIHYNDTDNYKIRPMSKHGLCLDYKGDNSIIKIEKRILESSHMCFEIESPKHGSVVLYDHRVRRSN